MGINVNDLPAISIRQGLDMRTGVTAEGKQVLQLRLTMKDSLDTTDISLVQTMVLQEAIDLRNTINRMVDEMIEEQNSSGN